MSGVDLRAFFRGGGGGGPGFKRFEKGRPNFPELRVVLTSSGSATESGCHFS